MPILDTASKRRTQNRYLLVLAILVLLVLIAYLLGLLSGKRGTISGTKLRCVVSQDVTPFDDRILYYDNSTLFCLAANGSELWKASVGENASSAPVKNRWWSGAATSCCFTTATDAPPTATGSASPFSLPGWAPSIWLWSQATAYPPR